MIPFMGKLGTLISTLGRSWHTGFLLFLVAYFSFHAFSGEGSIHTLRSLKAQEIELEALANDVAAERAYLEHRTASLSGAAIDPDLLEEQVRHRLGFTHPDEVIILEE